eukprot:jgi/Botrbrau1/13849/Bobra.0056s0085.1
MAISSAMAGAAVRGVMGAGLLCLVIGIAPALYLWITFGRKDQDVQPRNIAPRGIDWPVSAPGPARAPGPVISTFVTAFAGTIAIARLPQCPGDCRNPAPRPMLLYKYLRARTSPSWCPPCCHLLPQGPARSAYPWLFPVCWFSVSKPPWAQKDCDDCFCGIFGCQDIVAAVPAEPVGANPSLALPETARPAVSPASVPSPLPTPAPAPTIPGVGANPADALPRTNSV